MVFVNLVGSLHKLGVLQKLGLTPLMCASSQSEYAQTVKAAFLKAVPTGRLEERFLGTEDLGEIYSHTLLNIHPCKYDAFGMTIVEAASLGAPSLVHNVRPLLSVNVQETRTFLQNLFVDISFDLHIFLSTKSHCFLRRHFFQSVHIPFYNQSECFSGSPTYIDFFLVLIVPPPQKHASLLSQKT